MVDRVKNFPIEGMTLDVINYPRDGDTINLIYVKIYGHEKGNLINYESNKMISIPNTDYENFKEAVIHRDDKGTGGVTAANSVSRDRPEYDATITKTLAMFNQTGSEANPKGGGRKTRRRRKQHKKKSRKSRN